MDYQNSILCCNGCWHTASPRESECSLCGMGERYEKIVVSWVPQPIGGMLVLENSFVTSLLGFLTYDAAARRLHEGYTFANLGYIPASRNKLAESFLDDTTADWLLMLDWDVAFPPEAPYVLLDAADPVDRPIISGAYVTYFGEGNNLRPCWLTEVEGVGEHVPVSEFRVGEIVPLTTCGMGFTLIHRGVLEALRKEHHDDSWPFFGHDDLYGSRAGEDLTFCTRARRLGFSVWGHGGVLLGHTKAKMLLAQDMLGGQAVSPATRKRVLNVGGGTKEISLPAEYAGWEHVLLDIDGSRSDVDLVMDARHLDTLEGEQFDAAYCSHNLEHYNSYELPFVLEGILHVLKPEGRLHVRVPDMGVVLRRLAEGADLDDQAYVSSAGPIMWRDMIYGYDREIERSGNDFYQHRTGFTLSRLRRVLCDAGFENIVVVAHENSIEIEAYATKAGSVEQLA